MVFPVNSQFNPAGFVAALDASADAAPQGVDPNLWEQVKRQANNYSTRGTAAYNNFTNANVNKPTAAVGRAGKLGIQVGDGSRAFSKALTGRTALGLGAFGAGAATALNGGGIAETLLSGGGAAGGIALAGKLAGSLGKLGGPIGGLLGAGAAIAVPMVTQAIGAGIGRKLDGSPQARAMAQGVDANAQSTYNPNSTGNVIDSNLEKLSKQELQRLLLLKQAGYDNVDLQEEGMRRIAMPMMNKQHELRAKMLPLDTAARLAVNTNASVGNMYNTSIAGTSDIARQIAANNPYGQVMV
jgi:hypothetical protein